MVSGAGGTAPGAVTRSRIPGAQRRRNSRPRAPRRGPGGVLLNTAPVAASQPRPGNFPRSGPDRFPPLPPPCDQRGASGSGFAVDCWPARSEPHSWGRASCPRASRQAKTSPPLGARLSCRWQRGSRASRPSRPRRPCPVRRRRARRIWSACAGCMTLRCSRRGCLRRNCRRSRPRCLTGRGRRRARRWPTYSKSGSSVIRPGRRAGWHRWKPRP